MPEARGSSEATPSDAGSALTAWLQSGDAKGTTMIITRIAVRTYETQAELMGGQNVARQSQMAQWHHTLNTATNLVQTNTTKMQLPNAPMFHWEALGEEQGAR